ncbi:sensor histidine kinase [Hahella chejuensis]|uniref:sensor histidine kinase n=1 Tax=Hahella chejuensis TaxID=158327 RepID=UPI0002E72E5A|nr:DUF4118 domain-containing protein [Hahella chejuensis]
MLKDINAHFKPKDFWLATLIMLGAMLASLVITQVLAHPNVLLVLFLGVLAAGVKTSVWPALWSALLGFFAYNYFFTHPHYTLKVTHSEDLLTIIFFLLVSTISGNLAVRLKEQVLAIRESKREVEDLLSLSSKLSLAPDRRSIMEVALKEMAKLVSAPVLAFEKGLVEQGSALDARGEPFALPASELALARRIWEQSASDSSSARTSPEQPSQYKWLPVCSEMGVLCLLGVPDGAYKALDWELHNRISNLTQQLKLSLLRTKLNEELEEVRFQAETERLRAALLSSVSHDLKTPLAAMIGSAGSLLQYHDRLSDEDRKELMETTLQEAERLDRYIQNLLDMTRLGYGALKLHRDWTSLHDIVGAAVKRLVNELKPLKVNIELAPDIPLLYVHAALLEQALINILENAAKFSPEGGRIDILASVESTSLIIDVIDQGPGIPPEEREQVFNMFYSVTKGDRKPSTGLGLAICHGMIGAHGGSVEALDGKDGRGADIRIILPVDPQPESDPDGALDGDPAEGAE